MLTRPGPLNTILLFAISLSGCESHFDVINSQSVAMKPGHIRVNVQISKGVYGELLNHEGEIFLSVGSCGRNDSEISFVSEELQEHDFNHDAPVIIFNITEFPTLQQKINSLCGTIKTTGYSLYQYRSNQFPIK